MSYSHVITNPLQQAILAILLMAASFSTGYSVSDHQAEEQATVLEEQFRSFDQFSYKAPEVNAMMQETFANPTEERLRVTNNRLKINYANWEHREFGENKELFHDYRLACQAVIDDLQETGQADTSKMNRLYSELVPDVENVKVNEEFFWTSQK